MLINSYFLVSRAICLFGVVTPSFPIPSSTIFETQSPHLNPALWVPPFIIEPCISWFEYALFSIPPNLWLLFWFFDMLNIYYLHFIRFSLSWIYLIFAENYSYLYSSEILQLKMSVICGSKKTLEHKILAWHILLESFFGTRVKICIHVNVFWGQSNVKMCLQKIVFV